MRVLYFLEGCFKHTVTVVYFLLIHLTGLKHFLNDFNKRNQKQAIKFSLNSNIHIVRYPKARETKIFPCSFSRRSNSPSMLLRTVDSRTVELFGAKLVQAHALSNDSLRKSGEGHFNTLSTNNFFWSDVKVRFLKANHLSMIWLKALLVIVGTSMKLSAERTVDWKIKN